MSRSRMFAIALAVASPMALPLAAHAQTTDEEITVTGRYGRVPDNVQSLSQAVSYSDLDLSTAAGRDELRRRVRLTSRWLCEKLGESDTGDAIAPSCRDAATSDALKRVGTLEEHWTPRGTTWVAPPAWAPPYPVDWVKRYP